MPEEVDRRLGEIETAIAAFEERPVIYDPAEIARAGVFASIDGDGHLRIARGYVQPEDEAPVSAAPDGGEAAPWYPDGARAVITIGGVAAPQIETPEEDDGVRPLSERLVTELTAQRTLALRDALANAPDMAFVAVLHALCLGAFYHYASDTCLEITAKSSGFGTQAPGLNDTPSAKAIEARHDAWARQLPEEPGGLWDALTAFDDDSRTALFAHCASVTVNVVKEPWNRRPGAFEHGDRLARAVDLDMVAAGWAPTVDNYLSRVPKARILEAVREGKGEASAQLIDHLKKADMAKEAERLLAGTGWLPEPLRTPAADIAASGDGSDTQALPAFLADEADPEQPVHQALAAE
jgi:ParB family chromosome partitioning protein